MAETSLRASLRQRLRDWALRRQGADVVPCELQGRRIYILPTHSGWTFAALLAVMFTAGMNYGNGLALLLTFWLTGFALIAMVRTQRALSRTRLLHVEIEPAFAGGSVLVRLQVAARTPIHDLGLSIDGIAGASQPASEGAGNEGVLLLQVPAHRRGPWHLPPLRISCSAPFGLFRTWTWLALEADTLVYPRAAGTLPIPETIGDESGTSQTTQGQDELAWLRDFREGDSPRQVAWKAYARGAPLLVREYRGRGAQRQVFDFASLGQLDVEARLSQLARWIVDAHARGEGWVLQLPGSSAVEGIGAAHRQDCLSRLALYGLRSGPP